MLSASSSERRKAPVKPSSNKARLRRPVGVVTSILLIVRLKVARVKAAACLMRVFFSRAIPCSSTLIFLSAVGESSPANSCALAIAEACRWMVATFLPASANSVRKPANASTDAGNESRWWVWHQAVKRDQSPA